jgi:hypothetical protein
MDREPSALLNDGAPHWCLLRSVSNHSQSQYALSEASETCAGGGGVRTAAARRALVSGRARARLNMVSDSRLTPGYRERGVGGWVDSAVAVAASQGAEVSSAPRISRVQNVTPGTFNMQLDCTQSSRNMSKRNSDGDVLTNRLSLGLAKHQKLLSSWLGPSTSPGTPLESGSTPRDEQEDEHEQNFGHDR